MTLPLSDSLFIDKQEETAALGAARVAMLVKKELVKHSHAPWLDWYKTSITSGVNQSYKSYGYGF
jgi:hypothetical protein